MMAQPMQSKMRGVPYRKKPAI